MQMKNKNCHQLSTQELKTDPMFNAPVKSLAQSTKDTTMRHAHIVKVDTSLHKQQHIAHHNIF
jgi:hypothetical protein